MPKLKRRCASGRWLWTRLFPSQLRYVCVLNSYSLQRSFSLSKMFLYQIHLYAQEFLGQRAGGTLPETRNLCWPAFCKDYEYAGAARRIKCILFGPYCLLIVFLKILYCDDPLAGIVLGKFTLQPKEKSYSCWTCYFFCYLENRTLELLLRRPPASS